MPTNPKEYTNLRTLLDSLEIGALRYYLSGTGLSQPLKFKYIRDKIQPIIDELWHSGGAHLIECPTGYYDCDGCCVPYKCPEISNISTRRTKATKKTAKAAKKKR